MTGILTPSEITQLKGQRKITCLTAYSAPMARMLDGRVDMILVGDSLGMVLYGMDNTLEVTLEMMIAHGQAVMRGAEKTPVVIDMPYGTYEDCPALATENANFMLEKTGAAAVKLEGGVDMGAQIKAIVTAGIPVMAHIGLQPQSVERDGGYKVKGRSDDEITRILDDARAVEKAGAFSVVVEGTLPDLAAEITSAINIPTIGIGASAQCDGQVLVTEDMLGLSGARVPKFVKSYVNLAPDIERAVQDFASEVDRGDFPADEHLYK